MPARPDRGRPSPVGHRDKTTKIARSVDAFRRILRLLRVAARKTELATGLSSAQLFVLSAVGSTSGAGCSVNDIAEATMTDRSSVAAIVDRLAEQGYVTRSRSGVDRRRASIAITARGRRATGTSAPAPTALLIDGLRGLSPAQLHGLTRGLAALTQRMGIAEEPVRMLFEEPKGARAREPEPHPPEPSSTRSAAPRSDRAAPRGARARRRTESR